MTRALLLGGTTEASQMARVLAEAGVKAVFSYAGRTQSPVPQPLPMRVGGFGGVSGLSRYLRSQHISHVIDATHPFAEGMSRNAIEACHSAHVPLVRLERPAWVPAPRDNWTMLSRLEDIPDALPDLPTRVFLAIGKQHLALFMTKPQHHYLLRLVDEPDGTLPLPSADVVIARGPFDVDGDHALMQSHDITHVVAKNSGGTGARAKLDAARILGLQVLMAQRPLLPRHTVATTPREVMQWLGHDADLGV
ncbi:MAG: cobalt-precorrin-6A reductase [Sulfitobacter sp.]